MSYAQVLFERYSAFLLATLSIEVDRLEQPPQGQSGLTSSQRLAHVPRQASSASSREPPFSQHLHEDTRRSPAAPIAPRPLGPVLPPAWPEWRALAARVPKRGRWGALVPT